MGPSLICESLTILLNQVTSDDAVWRPQMVWMALNYTLAPLACIIVAEFVKSRKQPKKRASTAEANGVAS